MNLLGSLTPPLRSPYAQGLAGSAEDSETSGFATFLTDVVNAYVDENDLNGSYQAIQSGLRYALQVLSNNIDSPINFLSGMTSGPFGWGAQCEDDRVTLGRGGYCNFKIEHL